MGVLAYWPLALLILVPAIVILYILRQQAKKQRISSTMLWAEAFRNNEATKPWERLRRNLLLLLQILAVLVLILALMRPWLRSADGTGRLAILVIDSSASMSAGYSDGKSRLEAAKEAAQEYVDGLADGTTIHVIQSDRQAVLLLGGSQDKMEARRRIASIEQTALPGDLSVSLGLVRSCASQSKEPEIVFFTDSAFDLGDLSASVKSFYSEGTNLAMEGVSAVWREDTLEALMMLSNQSAADGTTEINLYGIDESGEERLLEIGSADVPSGEISSVYLEISREKAAGVTALRAEINEEDSLPADNSAWCVLEEEGISHVLLLSGSNLFLEKAIGNQPGIELVRSDDPKVAESDYDLYIFDGLVPEVLPESGSFLFIGCREDTYAPEEETVKNRTLTLAESEVTDYVENTEIGVNQAWLYRLPVWGTSFLNAGEGKSAGYYGICGGHRTVVLGFDLHETDFGLRAEFPILMSDLCGYLTRVGLTDGTSYTAGDGVLLHGSMRGSELVLVLPDGTEETLSAQENSGSYLEVTQPGIYAVSQEQSGQWKRQQFCVNFPVGQESRVEPAESMEQARDGARGVVRGGTRELKDVFLLILLILLLAEWAVYLHQK